MKSKNLLLVCSDPFYNVEECLRCAGCDITEVTDGRSALSLTKHHLFDAAVLISSGTEMDLTETALNLRDLNPLMPIFIIVDRSVSGRKRRSRPHIAELIPKTITVGIQELTDYLAASNRDSAPPEKFFH